MSQPDSLTDRERALCRDAVRRTLFEREREDRRSNVVDKDAWAERLYPGPVPELPEVEHDGVRYRYNPTIHDYEYHAVGGWCRSWAPSPMFVRALASLLPKRELTDEIVRKADSAYVATPATYLTAMRAALLAVWDDIAALAAPVPKPQWWGVVNKDGKMRWCDSLVQGRDLVGVWDRRDPDSAPHRVVALAEVPHAE